MRFLSSTSNPTIYKPPNIEKLDVLQHIQNADNTDNIDSYRKGLQSQLMSLSRQINVERELKTLQEIKGYISSALNLIKAKNNFKVTSLPPAKQQPPNKCILPQRPFFSTKRKRKTNIQIAKPNKEEKNEMYKTLLEGALLKEYLPMTNQIYCKYWYMHFTIINLCTVATEYRARDYGHLCYAT